MNKFSLCILLVALSINLTYSQGEYWIYFSDKGPESEYFMTHPGTMLSQRSLDRRKKQNIPVDLKDVPVSKTYISELETGGVNILAVSKWINAVVAQTTLNLVDLKRICPSVTDFKLVRAYKASVEGIPGKNIIPSLYRTQAIDYGYAQIQNDILNISCLHDQGFTGDGILLAIFDAGFNSVDTMAVYDSSWIANRFLNWYDFVDDDTLVFQEDLHGQYVLSTIASNSPGLIVGTAPHVSLLLARTETVFSESHQEEYNWLEAMEWADSIGADLIHTSLGYSIMDSAAQSYFYADMDGNTTIISLAADLAASRGILVNASAGNEGTSGWHYIMAPCDGDSVLCVGSVDTFLIKSPFSSFGPSADGDIKPDVMAMGMDVAVMSPFGPFPLNTSGTSLSAPQVAGFAACLMQAHPFRTAKQIADAIRQSAHRFLIPDSLYGYGVPNACKADSILSIIDHSFEQTKENSLSVFPNPFSQFIHFYNTEQINNWNIYDYCGRLVLSGAIINNKNLMQLDLQQIPAGLYLLNLIGENGETISIKIVKSE